MPVAAEANVLFVYVVVSPPLCGRPGTGLVATSVVKVTSFATRLAPPTPGMSTSSSEGVTSPPPSPGRDVPAEMDAPREAM